MRHETMSLMLEYVHFFNNVCNTRVVTLPGIDYGDHTPPTGSGVNIAQCSPHRLCHDSLVLQCGAGLLRNQ